MNFDSNAFYHLVSHGGQGLCLNVQGLEQVDDNRNVNVYRWEEVGAQRWRVEACRGYCKLYSALADSRRRQYTLDYYRGKGNAGNCDVYRAAGGDADTLLELRAVRPDEGLYRLQLACHPQLYLTATGKTNGADVRWQPYTGGEEQLWKFAQQAGGGAADGNTDDVPGETDGGVTAADDAAVYPCKVMNITQRHDGSYSHRRHSVAARADWPVDEAGADSGRCWMYCPCDEMEVRRVYGVGNGGTNTVWLRSTAPVRLPGEREKQYLVMMVTHPNDDTLASLRVGQRFARGEAMFREGNDGNATGYHFHISCGTGDLRTVFGSSCGWTKNENGMWVLTVTGRTLRVDEAFYLDTRFTTVKNAAGYAFQRL